MLAAKKAKSPSQSNQEAPHGELSAGAGNANSAVEVGTNDSVASVVTPAESESVPLPTSGAADGGVVSTAPTPAPAGPATNKPIIGGLRLNALRIGSAPVVAANTGADRSPEVASPGVDSDIRDSVSRDAAGQPDSNLQPDNVGEIKSPAIGNLKLGSSLVDIAGLGEELDGIDPGEEDSIPLDHIPVTAPARSLPENLTNQQAQFIKSLDSIYNLHADPGMFVDMVRRIMTDMQENPALVSLLADDDSFTMITGLRQQAGMAQVKKVEAKEKRGTGSGARTTKSKSVEDSVMASLSAFAGMPLD